MASTEGDTASSPLPRAAAVGTHPGRAPSPHADVPQPSAAVTGPLISLIFLMQVLVFAIHFIVIDDAVEMDVIL